MPDCSAILEKVNTNITDLEKTLNNIGHGFTQSFGPNVNADDLGNPMVVYDLIDAIQDVRDSIITAKMFGCISEKQWMPYASLK